MLEWVLQEQDWDLDKAIAWFNEHKDDDEEKDYLQTEDEAAKEKPGISLFYTIHHLFVIFTSPKYHKLKNSILIL